MHLMRLWLIGVLVVGYMTSSSAVRGESDKFRLSLRDDPTRTMVVGWCQRSGERPRLHYGEEDNGREASAYPNSQEPTRRVTFRGLEHAFVRLTGLEPDTAYYFVVRDSDSVSRRYWFQTLPSGREPLRFVAGGDSRNNRSGRRDANRMVARLRPHFVGFAGDFTAYGSAEQWANWLDDWRLTISDDGRMTPIIPARGNHEPSNEHVFNIFDAPSPDNYYAIPIANNWVRWYTLNTHISVAGDQAAWLAEDLAKNRRASWRVAQYHAPMRPHTRGKPEGNRLYEAWAGLFYEHGVNLVIECDSHLCKITWPIRPAGPTDENASEGFVRDDESGTVYVGEGSWGAPLRPANDLKPWTRASGSFHQVKWGRISQEEIAVRAVYVDNVASVGSVRKQTPWTPPKNLRLLDVSGGDTVVIPARAAKATTQ